MYNHWITCLQVFDIEKPCYTSFQKQNKHFNWPTTVVSHRKFRKTLESIEKKNHKVANSKKEQNNHTFTQSPLKWGKKCMSWSVFENKVSNKTDIKMQNPSAFL